MEGKAVGKAGIKPTGHVNPADEKVMDGGARGTGIVAGRGVAGGGRWFIRGLVTHEDRRVDKETHAEGVRQR